MLVHLSDANDGSLSFVPDVTASIIAAFKSSVRLPLSLPALRIHAAQIMRAAGQKTRLTQYNNLQCAVACDKSCRQVRRGRAQQEEGGNGFAGFERVAGVLNCEK